mmetsp:Transcript_42075/g.78182  ORF Transcript_42075/g.78182 Transcript_42075/m.78182 type:complete len:86 (+) Transcript_42075:276-533(+)
MSPHPDNTCIYPSSCREIFADDTEFVCCASTKAECLTWNWMVLGVIFLVLLAVVIGSVVACCCCCGCCGGGCCCAQKAGAQKATE